MDEYSDFDFDEEGVPPASGRRPSSPSIAAASGAAAVTPRRTTPPRHTKTHGARAKTSNLFFKEVLQPGNVAGRSEYARVVRYETNPNFDESTKACGPEDIGQCVAKLLKDTGHWRVWRHDDGNFVVFDASSESFKGSIYDIDSLKEGKDKFSSYEALGNWAQGGSGFFDFDKEVLNSKDETMKRFVEAMGLATDESGDLHSSTNARADNNVDKTCEKKTHARKRKRKMSRILFGKHKPGRNTGDDDTEDSGREQEDKRGKSDEDTASLYSFGWRGDGRMMSGTSSDEGEGRDYQRGNLKTTGESSASDEEEEEEEENASPTMRPYFSPPMEESTLDQSQRACVAACSAFLGHGEKMGQGPQFVSWDRILKEISPDGSVIRSFGSVAEFNSLPQDTRDGLYVATVTRKKNIGHHAMVLWKERDQLGSTDMMLFDPGSGLGNTRRTVDMRHKRIVSAGWDGICAVFVPGSQVPEQVVEQIAITDLSEEIVISSSDEDDEEPAGRKSPPETKIRSKVCSKNSRGKASSARKIERSKCQASSTALVSDSQIVRNGKFIDDLFDTINQKYKCGTATKKEKQFFGHLREYLREKSYELRVSDFNTIQTFIGSFESSMEKLKNASDDTDVDMFTRRVERIVRECNEELPLMKIKSEEE